MQVPAGNIVLQRVTQFQQGAVCVVGYSGVELEMRMAVLEDGAVLLFFCDK